MSHKNKNPKINIAPANADPIAAMIANLVYGAHQRLLDSVKTDKNIRLSRKNKK